MFVDILSSQPCHWQEKYRLFQVFPVTLAFELSSFNAR
jgi:hypothetical protein